MKLVKLSKNKIQLDQRVPIYVKGFETPATHIDIQIRYKKDKDYMNRYVALKSSVNKYTEKIAFKWKIGDIQSIGTGYIIKGITPHYLPEKFDEKNFNVVVQYFMIDDQTFIQKMRDKKINDILGLVL